MLKNLAQKRLSILIWYEIYDWAEILVQSPAFSGSKMQAGPGSSDSKMPVWNAVLQPVQ